MTPSPIKCCAVVPVFNHEEAVGTVVQSLRRYGLPVILVDDGSSPTCAAVLDQLSAGADGIYLQRHAKNQGKGGAVMTGFRAAAGLGFSHALQIDADGQHDSNDIPAFLAAATAHPQALICGYPIYDDSVPKVRLYARYATHIWVWINTVSLRIRDSMCGFRIYPLPATLAMIDRVHVGRRMDFDTEIVVRLDWEGVAIVNQGTRVGYPLDGQSHFRLWLDNVLISSMHARLFFGMLPRLPRLLWRLIAGGKSS